MLLFIVLQELHIHTYVPTFIQTYLHVPTHLQYTAKNPSRLMKRNGTERAVKWNGTGRSRSVLHPFEVRAYLSSVLIKYYYIRTALSALARGSLWFLLKSVTRSRSLNHALSLRTFFLLFLATLSQNCTAGHGFRLDLDFFTRAGVRRYLNSNGNNKK